MWNPFKSSEKQTTGDDSKLKAANEKALSGLSLLAIKVKTNNTPTVDDSLNMQTYLERLRREGAGV